MNRYKALLSDTIVIGIGNFTTKLIYFFLMPIYTVSLSEEQFGKADLLFNLAALLLPVFTMSVYEGVFRFVLDKKEDPNRLLSTGLSITLASSGVSILIFFSVFAITNDICWLVFCGYFILESFRCLLAQFSRGSGYVKEFSLNGIIAAVVLFVSTYILVKLLSLGVVGYLLSFVIANVCAIAFLVISVDKIKKFCWIYSKEKTKEILCYSIPLIPNTLSWWVTNVSSRYILAYNCGLAIAGLFSATSKLPALINIMSSIFQQSWQISSVKESESDDSSAFYGKVFSVYSSCIFIAGSLIIVGIPVISKFVLKGSFYDAWPYTPFLLFSAILGCFSVYFGNFYTITKNSKAIMRTTLYGAILNVVCCICMIPFWGIYGALVSNVLSFILIVVIRYIDTQRFMPIKIEKSTLLFSFIMLFAICLGMTIANRVSIIISCVLACLVVLTNMRTLLKK